MKTVSLTIEVPCDRQVRVADVREAVADALRPLGLVRSDRPRGTLPEPETRVVGHIDFTQVRLLFRTGPRRAST
jgi:hypothetical protein